MNVVALLSPKSTSPLGVVYKPGNICISWQRISCVTYSTTLMYVLHALLWCFSRYHLLSRHSPTSSSIFRPRHLRTCKILLSWHFHTPAQKQIQKIRVGLFSFQSSLPSARLRGTDGTGLISQLRMRMRLRKDSFCQQIQISDVLCYLHSVP